MNILNSKNKQKKCVPRFGRYTVAALEAKIQQYERDVEHLKRALERSDQYIEDLESQVRKPESRCVEGQETHGNSKAGTDALTQQQKINMMMRSLSDSERGSICSNPEADYRTFSRNPSFMCMPSATHKELGKTESQKKENLEDTSADFLPTTPSSAFRSLTLRSPGIREKKIAFKPVSYLRRLDFEEFPSPDKTSSTMENHFSLDKFTKGLPPNTDVESSKSAFWGGWQRADSNEPGPSKEAKGATSANLVGDKPDSFQMSSEASMDAAYLDKISELDSMMLDGESSSSRESQLSLGPSPPPEAQTCPDVSSSHTPRDNMDEPLIDKESPQGTVEERFGALEPATASDAHVPGSTGQTVSSQTDELSFDLLFDSLEENKAGPAGSLSQVNREDHHVNASTSSSCTGKPANTDRDRQEVNASQPVKRKSHSPFNTSSPTKHSKLK